MVVCDRLHVRPELGTIVVVRTTTPVKPLRLLTVSVEFPADPALTRIVVGLAVKVKSSTVYDTVVLWDREPLVPVTVTVYSPAVP